MTTALEIQNGNDLVTFDREKVELIKRTVAKNANDDQLALFLHQAQRTGLDPLSKQIHCIMRWNNREKRYDMSIQTAIDGYRLVADRTGKYAGSDDYRFNEGLTQFEHLQVGEPHPVTATVTVYKIVAGQRVPFTATAAWAAYCPGGNQAFMWNKMPHLMLGKCAEALALRKAFPAELSGMYVREEMDQSGFNDVVEQVTSVTAEYDDDIPVVDESVFDFAEGDEVVVAGDKDEKLGTFVRLDGALLVVKVDKKEYRVAPNRVKMIEQPEAEEQPALIDAEDVSEGAYAE